ncbi:MAG: thiamine phosphate synthase, partial [Spirochaetales bacterium]|nr:thiamine phosphate synthase [Spirochaetales bacterium]
EVCRAVPIPVYGLGGIHPQNVQPVIDAGAAGVCMMSEFMKIK